MRRMKEHKRRIFTMGIGDESFISIYFLCSRSILRDVEMNKKNIKYKKKKEVKIRQPLY
jgi:hypothetical protein